jgi:transcriptional regulator with XRE-family HTH domain
MTAFALSSLRRLKDNIDALLRARRLTRKDLAFYCRKSESWISKIFREERRGFGYKDLDRIAAFFGLDVFQLFQPGISPSSERRLGVERRGQRERRIGPVRQHEEELAQTIEAARPVRRDAHAVAHTDTQASQEVLRLANLLQRQLQTILEKTGTRRQTRDPRRKKSAASDSARVAG